MSQPQNSDNLWKFILLSCGMTTGNFIITKRLLYTDSGFAAFPLFESLFLSNDSSTDLATSSEDEVVKVNNGEENGIHYDEGTDAEAEENEENNSYYESEDDKSEDY